jgi:CheY-like chemotaxis protein
MADRTSLESAILNLVVNARDAMPAGGILTISTGVRIGRAGDGLVGERVSFVSVSDTGTGMSPEVLERVFEPFFTTKDVGKGTGLGLPTVYGFAEQSGGHVRIDSREGDGTAVTILLPAVEAEDNQPSIVRKVLSQRGRGERILVVEDEPQVLQFVCSQLEVLGYRVEAVTTGRDALALLQSEQKFDLMLSDVVLPQGMSGVDLARQASAVRPELKVVLTSGYPDEVFQQLGMRPGALPLLRKPYRRQELSAIVSGTLAEYFSSRSPKDTAAHR